MTREDGRKHKSEERHSGVFKATKLVLLTRIMTGKDLKDLNLQQLSPWSEFHTIALSEVMIKIWKDQKRILDKNNRSMGLIDCKPPPVEARKLLDCIGDFRSFLMKKIRIVVQSHIESYPLMSSPKDLGKIVSELLKDLQFTRQEPEKKEDMVWLTELRLTGYN